ncbi:MAG: hydroxymethylglutaryl-CoA synthase [Enterococcus sp.]
MTVGIDKISFFVPPYYLDMSELAHARNVEPGKFLIGIGQSEMAINPISQDIITFAANAAQNILNEADQEAIDMVIVGTESSIDESKASAVVLHRLLGIQPFARSFEIKEACYGATAGLQMAKNHIQLHPESKVLVIATDIAKYGLNSGGEPTQGAGAVAMLISSNPQILALEDDNVMHTQDIYDFWRPTGHDYPLVDGPLSNSTYIDSFVKVWQQHKKVTGLDLADYQALAFHIPYTKMGKKALLSILDDQTPSEQERILTRYEESIAYSRRVGNLYTGSLYLGLISLLENSTSLQAGNRIGLFSYGSGAVSEFFSGTLVNGFEHALKADYHQALLNQRQQLSVAKYEEIFAQTFDSSENEKFNDSLPFSITEINNTVRRYKED